MSELTTNANVSPISVGSNMVPISVGSNMVPISVGSNMVPISVGSNMVPISVGSNMVPISVDSNMVPISVDSNVTPVPNDSNATPVVDPLVVYDDIPDKMKDFKELLRLYYSTFFYDNKTVIRFIEDIDDSSGNFFDVNTRYLLNVTKPSNEYLNNKLDAEKYNEILNSISIPLVVLNHIIVTNNNSYNIYKSIYKVILTQSDSNIPEKTFEHNGIKYWINGNELHIYHKLLKDMKFTKINYDYKILTKTEKNESDIYDIKSNLLMFLFSFKDYNFKLQTSAFTVIIIVVMICYKFKIEMNSIYSDQNKLNVNKTQCDTISNLFTSMSDYETKTNNMIEYLANNEGFKEITIKCKAICPLTLSITNENIIVDNIVEFAEDYVVEIDNKTYDIIKADYGYNTLNNIDFNYNMVNKRVDTIVLNVYGDDTGSDVKCNKNPKINIKLNDEKTITIKPKNIIEEKHSYIKNRSKLNNLNSRIEKSKNTINKLAKNNDAQTNIVRNINLRMYIYYGIFATIIVAYIVMLLIDIDKTIKLNASGIVLILIGSMNVANYFLNYTFIENFSNYVPYDNCTKLISSQSREYIDKYVNNTGKALINQLVKILEKKIMYLSSYESKEFYKTLSGSLKNEVKAFIEYDYVYKYQSEVDKKSIDIMKHEIIDKTAFITFLSISFLIIGAIFVIHIYMDNNSYLKAYGVVVAILAFINLYIYYYKILHPVHTRARYNYWYKPSDSVQRNMS